jgi:ribosomal protein S14
MKNNSDSHAVRRYVPEDTASLRRILADVLRRKRLGFPPSLAEREMSLAIVEALPESTVPDNLCAECARENALRQAVAGGFGLCRDCLRAAVRERVRMS